MTTTALTPTAHSVPVLYPVLLLTALLAFTIGYTLPRPEPTVPTLTVQEDWHGNVRRSDWR